MAIVEAGARLPNPWEAVGRGTEVGRALFALYNGYEVARRRGNKYSDRNRMKILERISNQEPPDPYLIPCDFQLKQKKPLIKVPHFREKHMVISDIPQILLMRGRRKSSQILAQLKEELAKEHQPPAPKKSLLDDKEKARLQEIFEWSGRDVGKEDEIAFEVSTGPRKPALAKGSIEEQEMLIEAIAKEIEERKVFLDRMFELGRGPKYEPIIRLEIHERLRQMELLDKNITSMDKKWLEDRTQPSATSSDQTRKSNMQKGKPNSRASSRERTIDKQIKDIKSDNHSNTIRMEHIRASSDGCANSTHNDDEVGDFEGEESILEKSLDQQNRGPTNNMESGHNSRSSFEDFQGVNLDNKEHEYFNYSSQSENTSIASGQTSKCSTVQSGSIRSSLQSMLTHSSMPSGAFSNRHSTL